MILYSVIATLYPCDFNKFWRELQGDQHILGELDMNKTLVGESSKVIG